MQQHGAGIPGQLPVITGDKADATLRMHTHIHQLYVTRLNNEIIEFHSRTPFNPTGNLSLSLSSL